MSTTTCHFEERHLELRETLAQRGAAWREGEADGAEVIAAERRLDAFHERTDPLVDDQVEAHRRLAALLQDSVSNPIVRFSGVDLVQWAIRLSGALSDSQIALAALDEASRG